MGFTFEEFPDADYYRSDLRKILRYVREIEKYIASWEEIIAELREAVEKVNNFEGRIDALESETTVLDNRLDVLEPKVAQLRTSLEYVYTTLSEIDDWKELTDAKLLILGNRIDRLRSYVDEMDNAIMTDYNNKFSLYNLKMKQMYNQLKSLIDGLIERFTYVLEHLSSDVYNPIMDKRMTFDDNNREIFANLRYGGITEERLGELGLTENQLQALNLTQKEFAYNSVFWLKDYFLHSPCAGNRMSPYQCLSDILCWLCSTMTEAEFEALDLTEDEFKALNLTHYEYLRYNVSRSGVFIDPNGNGLTELQYQHLTVG